VDGEIQERNLGERDHADLQSRFVFLLCLPENEIYVTARSELRVQVRATRFRVPDVCVLAKGAPREQIVSQAPLLCIEILSPEDTMLRVRERVRDFLDMGVVQVWVVDPKSRSITLCSGSHTEECSSGELSVPKTPIKLNLADIFRVLDQA
jgi:Uma2 family endonuclease